MCSLDLMVSYQTIAPYLLVYRWQHQLYLPLLQPLDRLSHNQFALASQKQLTGRFDLVRANNGSVCLFPWQNQIRHTGASSINGFGTSLAECLVCKGNALESLIFVHNSRRYRESINVPLRCPMMFGIALFFPESASRHYQPIFSNFPHSCFGRDYS